MGCPGLHCNGCKGGGGAAALVIVVLVLIGAIGKAVSKALATTEHVLAVVLEVVVISIVVLVAAAVVWVLIRLGLRVQRWFATRARARQFSPAVVKATVLPAETQAIEQPRAQLTGTGMDIGSVTRARTEKP